MGFVVVCGLSSRRGGGMLGRGQNGRTTTNATGLGHYAPHTADNNVA